MDGKKVGKTVFLSALILLISVVGVSQSIDSATVRMEWEDEVFDREDESEEDFAYTVFDNDAGSILAGIINYGEFSSIDSDTLTTSEMTQSLNGVHKSSFIIPIARASSSDVEDRSQYIGEGFHDTDEFFEFANPNFGSSLAENNLVRAVLSYDTSDIRLKGFRRPITTSETIDIINEGREDGSTIISIER